MRVEVLVWIKDKIRGRYLGRHMDHMADSIAKLSQGRENRYIGREGIPVDDSSGEKCVPVIVFECMDLSISQSECVWIVLCFEQGTQVLG